jgi:hypothetical protein
MRWMPRKLLVVLFGLLTASFGHLTAAQTPYPTKFSPAIAARSDVRQALAYIDRRFDAQVAEWIALTQIPGTSGQNRSAPSM